MRKRVIYIIIGLLVAIIILLESFSPGFSHNSVKIEKNNLSQKWENILERE